MSSSEVTPADMVEANKSAMLVIHYRDTPGQPDVWYVPLSPGAATSVLPPEGREIMLIAVEMPPKQAFSGPGKIEP